MIKQIKNEANENNFNSKENTKLYRKGIVLIVYYMSQLKIEFTSS